MTTPASGSAALVGFSRELAGQPGIRDTAAPVSYVRPVLPLNARFGFAMNPAGEVNQSGFVEKGTPGAVTGPIDFGCRFSIPTLFFLLTHFFRDITKTEIETDIWQYVCEIDRTLAERTLSMLVGLPPVDQMWNHGVLLGGLVAQIGNNTEIAARLTGQALHFSRLGTAVADAGNTGTWVYKPVSRGPLAAPAAGNLFLEVTGLAPLRYKLEQAVGTTPPTMAGPTVITQLYDANGNAEMVVWIDNDGNELGIWNENKDPLMGCVPGTAAQHAAIVVGDTFYFPADNSWTLPTPTYLGGQRFTSAHQKNSLSLDDGATWQTFRSLTTNLSILDPIAADSGSESRYGFALERSGLQFNPTIAFTRKERDLDFRRMKERGTELMLRTLFEGQLLGAGVYRESLLLEWENAQLTALTDPVSAATAVVETATLQGITDATGAPPLTVTLITPEDYSIV